ncbi:multiheme c-type cytochrome [Sulfurimonas sp.]|uniref:multiheme c-type cytochrome n=1 Tax=Sulfurimonas sp. TaxID=2022749 RepID=UPI0025FB535C|nr:multiheme c-type cytochrome [Sulfurimonas sp.]
MIKIAFLLLLFSSLLFGANECIVCHKGIEDIRDRDSGMMKAILEVADKAGHKGNDCIVCHGGNPSNKSVKYAHKGTVKYFRTNEGPKNYYPAPASPWINENTCGTCHPNQVSAQMNSLMMTEQGKIQGAMWSFGAKEGYSHETATYNTKNPDNPDTRHGSEIYKKYMAKLSKMEPQGFPQETQTLADAPTVEEIHKDPSLAVNTYLRQECLRCHTGSKGRQKRGDYRGIGCASCHIPYSNEGYYEGVGKKISKKKGHLLTHQIQSSRKVKVQVHDIKYSGVPVETCATCHNRGKRIGVSYQGLMETEYHSTSEDEGNQPKSYLHMKEDIHYQKGMLCQDCHTSNDLHGDGFLGGANAAAVEIECQDCHGTTTKYPWELPIGYSDEFNTTAATGEARGTAKSVADYLKQGYVAEPEDGYILSARGNPLPKTVKKGNKIIMHLASGKDIELKPLKLLKDTKALSKKALIAMDVVDSHTQNMECYTCHATWAPQRYGRHLKVDYSDAKQNPDYLKASHDQDKHGTTGGMRDMKKYLIPGKVTETRSYLRWEDPALAQNGEGRVSPVVPGYQTTITVIGKDGEALLQNHIFKIQNVEGAGKEGQNAIDMAPIQPHTIQKESRSCESCHASDKAIGLGVGGGKLNNDPSKITIIDLMSPDRKILSNKTDEHILAIPNLKHDYSQFIDENGTQLMTVGNHFKLSQPLSKKQIGKLDRRGMCLSCHEDIPKGNLAVSAITHIAEMAEVNIDTKMHSGILNKLLNLGALVQMIVVILVTLLIMFVIYTFFFKKEPKNIRNEGWK